nr:hypothetical protein [Tanacetum cinerariifolium]
MSKGFCVEDPDMIPQPSLTNDKSGVMNEKNFIKLRAQQKAKFSNLLYGKNNMSTHCVPTTLLLPYIVGFEVINRDRREFLTETNQTHLVGKPKCEVTLVTGEGTRFWREFILTEVSFSYTVQPYAFTYSHLTSGGSSLIAGSGTRVTITIVTTPVNVIGVLQPVAPITAEQRLARKNELKARGTLLMALPDKHQLKFNSHKDAKTLMEATEKRFGRNTKTKKVQKTLLKQQFENFTGSSYEGLDQIHDRLQKLVSQLETHTLIWKNKADLEEQSLDDLFNNSTIDSVSAAASVSAACVKLPASSLPNIDVDDLEEMDLRWQMVILTMRARRKGHFARECRSLKDPRRPGAAEPQRRTVLVETSTSNALVTQCDGLESVEARLLVYKQNESVFEENIKLLNIKVQLRDTALVTLRHKLEKDEQERDDLKLKLEKFQPSGGYHVVPPPYTGTFMPPKPNLVFNTAPTVVETDHLAFNVQLSPPKPEQDLSHISRPILTQFKPVSNTAVRPVSAALPNILVTRPRNAHQVVTKSKSPIRRHITRNPSSRTSNSPPKVNVVQVPVLPDESQVLLRVPRENNMYNVNLMNIVPSRDLTCLFAKATLDESNLWHRRSDNRTEFKNSDLNQLCGLKGIKREFSVPRTPQQNGIAERKNQTLIEATRTMMADSLLPIPFWAEANFKGRLMKDFLLGNQTNSRVGFQDNSDAKKAGEEVDQSYMLFPVWSVGSTNPHNNAEVAAFDGKEHDFDVKKPESKVILSPSCSAQSKEQDDKTKKEAKGKSVFKSVTGYRDLNADAAGPSNTVVSPTYRKTSDIDNSQLPDDPDMPELEDIIYSDDKDVGAEVDFNNLESSILVSPIPTTRIHKDHPISQIIGDLSLTIQTRSMTRAVKDQGGLSQMFGTDFHTCMFACFLSQEEPKRVHQALKDPSWIEAMQEELLQFKMQKVWVLVDLPYEKEQLEEGIDYKEVFALVARIKAFRLFLDYASFIGFMVYQMDVKSSFLYGTIEEDVYVCQPLGFEDPDHPDKVYKVVKALYGLHQAARALYETLATYLLENGFQRGIIDQTLFIKKQKRDILLVQIYVDDIIFGATNKDLCRSFEKLMKDKFQMSSMGNHILLGSSGKTASTSIDTEKPLLKDPDGEDVDVHTY